MAQPNHHTHHMTNPVLVRHLSRVSLRVTRPDHQARAPEINRGVRPRWRAGPTNRRDTTHSQRDSVVIGQMENGLRPVSPK